MILIFQDTLNQNIVVTLAEKKRNITNKYLLVFTNEVSKVSFYCVVTDVSTSQYRYNKFCISHKFGTVDPMAGEVNMHLEGFYNYSVYENPNGVLLPDGLNLVETGKMKCIGSKKVAINFTPTNKTKKVFSPSDYNS